MPTIQAAVTKSWSAFFTAFLISLLLTGCGGGGGGGSGGGATPDTTAPTVSSTSPASNATGVAINTTVSATFSEAVSAASITTSTFTLKTTVGATAVSGTVALSGNTATFTPTPGTPLSYGTNYTATLTTGVQDAAGNALAAQQQWSFMTAAATTFTIGGTISGLTGTVTLQNNGADTLSRTTNATYTFATAVASGVAYSVTISAQPAGQTCSVANPTGSATANVTNVNISCTTNAAGTFTIGGSISGLTGTVVLQNNGADNLSRNANGQYNFATATGAYAVTVLTQPVGQVCTVANATGTAAAAVTNVNVSCVTNTYAIGGTISGLTGTVVLQNNGANDLSRTTNAVYSFSTQIAHGANYAVTVLSQPVGQTCTVANGSGTATAAVTNVNVSCVANTYTIGGSISGLTGTVVLQNNGANDLSRTTNAAFTFTLPITHGGTYTVTVLTPPAGQTCSIGNGSGTATANVTNITVTCGAAATYTLSGTITGSYGEGVTITRSGTGTTTATTNAAGAYSFTGLVAGNYTLTPALEGYTYAPAAPVVPVSADATQDFTATSVIPSYSVSGTVSYGGSQSAGVSVSAYPCVAPAQCSPDGRTGIPALVMGTGTYTIRGLRANTNYQIRARMGVHGQGSGNANNPAGNATANIMTANLTGINATLVDPTPPTPAVPTGLTVAPGDGGALVFWDIPENNGGVELATAYKVYWGTNPDGASNSAVINALARDDGFAAQTGLGNGSVYYYQVAALVGATESARSGVVGPITIGPVAANNTVSGSVTFTGTATGPMLVGVYKNNPSGVPTIYLTTITGPSSPQSYTITGVPSGSGYGNFAIIDMNNNNQIDQGDISNTNGDAPTITVSGATMGNITLSSASSSAKVNTSHWRFAGTGTSSYSLNHQVADGMKRVTKVTLASGKHIAVPHDLGKDNSEFRTWENIGTNVPLTSDAYTFKVFYSDGTNETIVRNVTAVLNTHALSLATSTSTGGGSVGAPLFTWAAPSPLPGFAYTYKLFISGGNANWNYPDDGDIPSTGPLQILYNADTRANPATLTTGMYNWNVSVQDADGNSAESGATYIVP